jgi:hypothetical protein
LTSYAWIFPNVVTNGHWWYSNTPTYIEHDASARLEAVPRSKQIGYYSDMYKLEFALPKFAMYKRILAKILAERYVVDRGWSEEQAVDFGRQVLRGNVETIFGFGEHARAPAPREAAAVPMGIPVYSDDVTEFDTVPDVAPVVSSPGDRHAGAAFEINDDDRQTVIEIDELADVDAPTQIGSADDGPKSS